jgi:hypothetical protein
MMLDGPSALAVMWTALLLRLTTVEDVEERLLESVGPCGRSEVNQRSVRARFWSALLGPQCAQRRRGIGCITCTTQRIRTGSHDV